MMAVRARAVQVMAALERRLPCLDDFVGQSWSVWAERANLTASDGSDADEHGKNGKKAMETMTLRKEDMSIFGHYPGHDDFYLVVCAHCSQVVKPQAFEKHCERRHGPLGKLYAHLRSPPPQQQQRPRHGHTPPSHGTSSWSGRNQNVGPPRASPQSPSTAPQFRHAKPLKDGVWHSEKTTNSGHSESSVFKQPPPIDPPRSSPPPPHRDPPWPHGGPSPSRPSSTERPQSQKGEAASAPVASGHLRGPRTYKMVTKKECDLDKHCGVMDPERKKVCTRLLTCNIHSIHQRRKVQGRSKNFDQLVAELKMSSKARERVSQAPESSAALSVSPEPPRDTLAPPLCRRPLTNSPAFRTPTLCESVEEKPHPEEGSTWPLSPLTQGHISGDESEGDANDDPADWHSTPWHPKPAALCSFGSRAVGHSVFTFDRRLHHLRSAMSAMVENHLSAHLWKKIPQASDSQSQSHPVKPAAVPASPSSISQHSKQKTGSHNSTSLKTSFYSSHGTSKEPNPQSSYTSKAYIQSENSGGCQSSATPPSSKLGRSPSQSGPGRPKNPVGRPSKQQLRLREAERTATTDAAALRKRKASFDEADTVSPDKNCGSQNKGRLLISKTLPSASHGQTNGSLSPGSKPRPPSDPHVPSSWAFKRTHPPAHHSSPESGPHSRGVDSGLHSRVASFDHKGLGKKRKSSGSSPPSKPHRLPNSPHSGFYPWKESKGAGLSVGGEKKLSTQKPKLHH
ncbi:ataxin-7-like protein 2 isoform X2 [Myxocyprinus asiaticus]|uniref:ataxin-7-like protein 2 isoform X2 n=1 Tax=Myxocyprinus asiaticus TaxID=70543 RepID=UPI00222187C3|nr:ataxin-7-like protein 2 isoform X2 [Myxocyprinus asiaticus]